MVKRIFVPASLVVAALVFALTLLAGLPSAGAQGTPPAQDGTAADHPAHIHSGTCNTLGDVVYPLNNLQAASMAASPAATPGVVTLPATPEATSIPGVSGIVAQSTTDVDVSLDDLLAEDFAINVHESPQNIQIYIACGDLTGTPENGELTIDLQELNASGFAGQAVLTDNGDGTTTVMVSLFSSAGMVTGTPVASPSS